MDRFSLFSRFYFGVIIFVLILGFDFGFFPRFAPGRLLYYHQSRLEYFEPQFG